MDVDKTNAEFLKEKPQPMYRMRTKGRFNNGMEYQTGAGVWMKDRDWKRSANPQLYSREKQREASDLSAIAKKKKQKVLQYKSLAEQHGLTVKHPRLQL